MKPSLSLDQVNRLEELGQISSETAKKLRGQIDIPEDEEDRFLENVVNRGDADSLEAYLNQILNTRTNVPE